MTKEKAIEAKTAELMPFDVEILISAGLDKQTAEKLAANRRHEIAQKRKYR